MADHHELVEEMAVLERMSTQERLKHAKKRRVQQLKRWAQREKELKRKQQRQQPDKLGGAAKMGGRLVEFKVHFVPSVMLLEAAARNDVEEVRRLLMMGVSADSTNEDGLTALHQCCIDDSEEMMKLLIEFGANVNAKDSEQWTPLHAAATCGHLHLVKHLIQKGADLLAVNADGNMPYDICEDETTLDHIETEMAKRGITQHTIDTTRAASEMRMLHELREHRNAGGDLDWRDEQLATPLHIAAANGYVSVVEFLVECGVATDAADCDLWQPIHAAACWGHPDVVEILVQAGADLNAKTKNGETPYDICEDPELKERIKELRNEMEIKRLSQLSQRLRRSHSQNTRSQSVRRTSIREKNKISRREAIEEARIRQENQKRALDVNGDDSPDSPPGSGHNNEALSNGDVPNGGAGGSDQTDAFPSIANNNQQLLKDQQQQQQAQQHQQQHQQQQVVGLLTPPRYEEAVQAAHPGCTTAVAAANSSTNHHTYETIATAAGPPGVLKSPPEGPMPPGILHDSDVKRFRGAEVVGGDGAGRFCCCTM